MKLRYAAQADFGELPLSDENIVNDYNNIANLTQQEKAEATQSKVLNAHSFSPFDGTLGTKLATAMLDRLELIPSSFHVLTMKYTSQELMF